MEQQIITLNNDHDGRYHRPKYQLLSKEKLIAPVTALALHTCTAWSSDGQLTQVDVCLIGRGPYVTVVPLKYPSEQDGDIFEDNSLDEQLLNHFAFGGRDAESGTVHGIHKVTTCCRKDKRNMWAFHGGKKISFALMDIAVSDTKNYRKLSKQISFTMTSFHVKNTEHDEKREHLSLNDWIWDVRVLTTDQERKDDDAIDVKFLSAIGMAQNTVEIWSLFSQRTSQVPTLNAIKLRKIICERRCITYSLSFYGWKNDYGATQIDCGGKDLELAVAVGTVSNQILIWSAINYEEVEKLQDQQNHINRMKNENSVHPQQAMVKKQLSHTLSGHLGVIYSCRFGSRGRYLVTTSDDRTVRLWKRSDNKTDDSNEKYCFDSPHETPNDVRKIVDAGLGYTLQWTGYSHTARVWDSDFISIANEYESFHGVISSGEDGSLKIWNVDDGSLIKTLKGHSCQNIWKVCSSWKRIDERRNKAFALSGANDGSVNTWDVTYYVSKAHQYCENFRLNESPQTLCGICFNPLFGGKQLLAATRDGQINSLNLVTKEWTYQGKWSCVTEEGKEINTDFGSCIEMHPTVPLALVGTTKGDIVLFSLLSSETRAYSASKYLAIQSISWLDECKFLAFHVKGIVSWWEIELAFKDKDDIILSRCNCQIKKVFNMKTARVGVPMSHYYDKQQKLLFLGDSRGNIALFDCESNSNDGERYPLDVLVYAHKKEHVTSIIPTDSSDCRGILSVGNDGHLTECSIVKADDTFKIQKSLTKPISNLTGVSYLWRTSTGTLIAGGYHGNQFVVVDINTNSQLMSIDSGGRNRRMIMWLGLQNQNTSNLSFTTAICVANKKGPFEIIVHSNIIDPSNSVPSIPKQLNVPFHGETVFDVDLCNMKGVIVLVSGSNDCSVKLSLIKESRITLIKTLPPHETCIRAISISHHIDSSSSIVAVCGGKLITTFYRLDVNENKDISVHFLCNTMLPIKSSIDHRINAVKAIPLSRVEENLSSHLVLSGDSDGGLHLTILTEELGQPRKVSSQFLIQDSRPILSIDVLRISESFFVSIVGTTAGRIDIWLLHEQPDGDIKSQNSPIYSYDAHTMGTNCLKASIVSNRINKEQNEVKVLICSGGDDQAIAVRLISLSISSSVEMDNLSIDTLASYKKSEACGSAIKGIDIVGNVAEGYRIYTSGYDQRMGIWALHIEETNVIRLTLLSSTPLDIKDINSLCCCTKQNEQDGSITEHILAGGEGLEVASFHLNTWKAAHALKRCNHLLITCGAGFSADSGLATYENMPEKYKNLCNPLRLVDSLNEFQNFWLNFAKQYKDVKPHRGYDILQSWCGGRRLTNLSVSENPWWIYSSNVDGHFDDFECFRNHICEIHGKATEFRCANKIGFTEGIRRDGDLWDQWNKVCSEYFSNENCNNDKIALSEINHKLPLICPQSNIPLRPNVLMFHDTDENVLQDIAQRRNLYQEWEAKVEDQVVNEDQHMVILELGAGKNVTAIREESEEVFYDLLNRLDVTKNSKGSVTLIRINPKDSFFIKTEDVDYPADSVISINEKAEHALLMIDQILSGFEK